MSRAQRRKAELYLVSRWLMMYGEQCSDDDVTRDVSYDPSFTGLGGVSLPGSRPDRQDQQQAEHHPGPPRSKRGSRSGVCHSQSSQENANWRNFSPGHGGSWVSKCPSGIFSLREAKVGSSVTLLRL